MCVFVCVFELCAAMVSTQRKMYFVLQKNPLRQPRSHLLIPEVAAAA